MSDQDRADICVAGGAAGPSLAMDFDGAMLLARPGGTIASTLAAHGRRQLSTAKDGRPRGLFCGMGVCHDCCVTVDGRDGIRACMTKVVDGMIVRSSPAKSAVRTENVDLAALPPGPLPQDEVDILVVGAGPAGLAAARAAKSSGASCLILDERPAPGGQYYKQPAADNVYRTDAQSRAGATRIAAVQAAGIEIRSETLVWGGFREEQRIILGTLHRGNAAYIVPKILIIATGAFEQPGIFPGWDLPGVMTTGAAQTLLRSHGVLPGRRILIAGNGPLNLQVAAELAEAGAVVVGVVEAAAAPWTQPQAAFAVARADPALAVTGLRHLVTLKRLGIPVHWGCRLIRAEGRSEVEAAVVSGPAGAVERIDADTVVTNEGFSPANDLARLLGVPHRVRHDGCARLEAIRDDAGATDLADIFVVGEAGGFGGAHVAEAQGSLAGCQAARRLGLSPPDDARATRTLAKHRRFQTALWRLFTTQDACLTRAEPDTIVCRCESVTLETIRTVLTSDRVADLASLKRLTRVGMGRCQGRYCLPRLAELVPTPIAETDFPAPQMPLKPIPLAALAVEKPEWGGHKRALLPHLPSTTNTEPLAISTADIVVIGAGIAGLSTALFLARGGANVVVLDRGEPNGRASGGNAGSLHAQLLSFDYGTKAEAGGSPAALTLPLQLASIALWQQLEREIGDDFEIAITGGLMVAETERDIAFLAEKTRVERSQGIDCEVIGANDLRALEPALDTGFVGAAFCPQEGKINPLRGTQGILKATLSAGARVLTSADVTAITRAGAGFVVETTRGNIHAGRIVNAGGAFASEIGRMLGRDVPVFGAPLQMIVTEAVAPFLTRLIAHADRHLTLKQAANGNVLIGGGWTAGLDPVHQHPRPLRSSLEGNLWVAQRVVPALRKLTVIRTWAAMNINIDGAPILGEDPGMQGLFHAVTSNGYTLGPLVGQVTAELMLTGSANRDIGAFSIARFKK